MSDNENTSGGLGSAFGSKTKGSQISYGHPYAKEIIDSAKEIIALSETGRLLLKSCEIGRIPISIIKGSGQSGFSPQARIIYLQVSGKKEKADSDDVLTLIKAMREADQELIGMVAPDPMKDIMRYAAVMHAKNLDSILYICKVVKELTNSSIITDFLDSLAKLGYGKVYKAYIANASKDEIFDIYAEA